LGTELVAAHHVKAVLSGSTFGNDQVDLRDVVVFVALQLFELMKEAVCTFEMAAEHVHGG